MNDGWQGEPTDGLKGGWRQRSVVVIVISSCEVIIVGVVVGAQRSVVQL